jgi:hypothetical protein
MTHRKIRCFVSGEPYHSGMTTLPALEERVITLEDFCFERLPHTMAAMNLGITKMYAETVANGEAIAGVRVDMAALQTSVHRDVFTLKAGLDLQGDSLRKEIGVTAASLRSDMASFREAVSQRFERVEAQLRGLRGDMTDRFASVDGKLSRMDEQLAGVDQRFNAVDKKFEAVGQRFVAVDQRFDTVDQRFDTVDQRFDAMDAKLDTIISELRRPSPEE